MKKYISLIIITANIIFQSCTTEKEIISSQNIVITSSDINQVGNEIIVKGEIISKSETKEILEVGAAWSYANYFSKNSNQIVTMDYTSDGFSIKIPIDLTYDHIVYVKALVITDEFYNFGSTIEIDYKVNN